MIGESPERLTDRQTMLAGLLQMTGPRFQRVLELAKVLVAADRPRQAWCIVSPLAHVPPKFPTLFGLNSFAMSVSVNPPDGEAGSVP